MKNLIYILFIFHFLSIHLSFGQPLPLELKTNPSTKIYDDLNIALTVPDSVEILILRGGRSTYLAR